jgi:hypothetical protein
VSIIGVIIGVETAGQTPLEAGARVDARGYESGCALDF